MKPEELVKAMEALKEACSSVSPDLVKNPHGQKPTNLGKPKSQLYDVMKGVYLAMEGITNFLSSLGSWNNLPFLLKASQPDDFLEDLRDHFNKCNDQPCSTENCWLCDEK